MGASKLRKSHRWPIGSAIHMLACACLAAILLHPWPWAAFGAVTLLAMAWAWLAASWAALYERARADTLKESGRG
jgi:hypothetical protein